MVAHQYEQCLIHFDDVTLILGDENKLSLCPMNRTPLLISHRVITLKMTYYLRYLSSSLVCR
jgi:hypothetical protein